MVSAHFGRSSLLNRLVAILILLTFVFSTADIAYAQSNEGGRAGDISWMLTATVLVLFMVLPGLILLNGASRSADEIFVSGILIFISVAVTTVIWGVYGYSLAFGNGLGLNPFIGSLDHLFLSNIRKDEYIGSIPIFVYAVFQLSFAIVTVALLCGAFDRNVNLVVFFMFVVLWVSLVYIPIAHWVWGGGVLAQLQFLDFAGGTVVHLSSGISAAILIARRGPVSPAKNSGSISNLQVLSLFVGASFLWLGWFGFNAGSALAAGETAAVAFITTLFGAAAAALVWFFFENAVYGYLRAPSVMTGALAGLVAITPASGFVQVGPAMLIGAVAGAACFVVSWAVRDVLKLDDPTDLISVHAAGGAIGTILTGVFATKRIGTGEGWIDGNSSQVLLQIAAVVVVAVWCIVVTHILISVLEAVFSKDKGRPTLLTAAPRL